MSNSPTVTSICSCGSFRTEKESGSSSNPGRKYFKCFDCGKFEWADSASSSQRGAASPYSSPSLTTRTPPVCRCDGEKAAVERAQRKAGPNEGRKFWTCARWTNGCGFFKWQDSDQEWKKKKNNRQQGIASVSPSPKARKRPPTPGYATFVPDWNQKLLLQKLLDVGVDRTQLRSERLNNSLDSNTEFDSFKMVHAWSIYNPKRQEQYEAALDRERRKFPPVRFATGSDSRTYDAEIPSELTSLVYELGRSKLDEKVNEVYLLHSTDPKNLHSILFEGFDPTISHEGLFGRGVYFAECAAKSDQYAVMDRKINYKEDEPLSDLHRKLYNKFEGREHPGQVYYCLVSRVILGRPVRTKDGFTQLVDGSESEHDLFLDTRRSQLAPIVGTNNITPSSVIAEKGGIQRSSSYREFVIQKGDQMFVEYLIAYQRRRKYCDCGHLLMERTVVKETENKGRICYFCPKDSCKFFRMEPRCFCGKSASVLTSNSVNNPGRKYYRCFKKFGGACDFFQWKDNESSTDSDDRREYQPKRLKFN